VCDCKRKCWFAPRHPRLYSTVNSRRAPAVPPAPRPAAHHSRALPCGGMSASCSSACSLSACRGRGPDLQHTIIVVGRPRGSFSTAWPAEQVSRSRQRSRARVASQDDGRRRGVSGGRDSRRGAREATSRSRTPRRYRIPSSPSVETATLACPPRACQRQALDRRSGAARRATCSLTLGLAWKATPSPASLSIGTSLAPSPTAITCAAGRRAVSRRATRQPRLLLPAHVCTRRYMPYPPCMHVVSLAKASYLLQRRRGGARGATCLSERPSCLAIACSRIQGLKHRNAAPDDAHNARQNRFANAKRGAPSAQERRFGPGEPRRGRAGGRAIPAAAPPCDSHRRCRPPPPP
jgi:hypothetical protein